MRKKQNLFIDIRKSDEVFSNRLEQSDEYGLYFFPMNMIRFNKEEIIKHLNYFNNIFIICQSANRSKYIKDKYFSDYSKIKVHKSIQFSNLKHGSNKVQIDGNRLTLNVIGSNSFNLYSIMRIVQLMLGTLILILGGYTYDKIKHKKVNLIPLTILLLFGLMAFINGITSTCTLSQILIDYFN